MELYSTLGSFLDKPNTLIGITGGGGKTTLMERFSKYLKSEGYSVLISTTTKVASPRFHDYGVDHIISGSDIFLHNPKKGESVFFAEDSYDAKKWVFPGFDELNALKSSYDVIIYEADGSRGLPLKYHSQKDPVILDNTDIVIGVMGLWGYGHKAYEMCFGDGSDRLIDFEYIQEYIDSPEGLCKGMERTGRGIIVLNGAESVDSKVIDKLSKVRIDKNRSLFFASEKENRIYGTI